MSGAYSAATAAALTIAGSAAEAYGNNQTLRKQDSIAAQGIRNQTALQTQAQQGVQKTIQKVGVDNAANDAQNQKIQQAQYMAALARAAPVQGSSLTTTPGASSRYAQQVVDAQAANKSFGAGQASLMARTTAPQLTQMQDQQNLGNEATQLGLLNDTSNSQANLTKLQAGSVQVNPWLLAASAALKGAGAGMSTYGGAKKVPGNGTLPDTSDGVAAGLWGG